MDIISAFAEGKVIQILNERDKWVDLTEREGLPMGTLEETPDIFRIKPELKYRPFANAEECWNEMQKHQPFGWVMHKKDGDRSLITNIDKVYNISLDGDDNWSFDKVMKFYTFTDGTHFGVKVEE